MYSNLLVIELVEREQNSFSRTLGFGATSTSEPKSHVRREPANPRSARKMPALGWLRDIFEARFVFEEHCYTLVDDEATADDTHEDASRVCL